METDLKSLIRAVPDFPKPGIRFYDITTLLQDPSGLRQTVDRLVWRFVGDHVDKVVGIESRGFLFAPLLACALNAGFVPVRKPGKLPYRTRRQEYQLEYGTDALEIHEDALARDDRVLVVDDLLATGGTAAATAALVESLGGSVVGLGFVIELSFLAGRQRLRGYRVESLLQYES
jgi:adenine phosphoribosyltransferase